MRASGSACTRRSIRQAQDAFTVLLGCGILAGAGIGGGGLNVPILMYSDFLFGEAVPISHAAVFVCDAQNLVNGGGAPKLRHAP